MNTEIVSEIIHLALTVNYIFILCFYGNKVIEKVKCQIILNGLISDLNFFAKNL